MSKRYEKRCEKCRATHTSQREGSEPQGHRPRWERCEACGGPRPSPHFMLQYSRQDATVLARDEEKRKKAEDEMEYLIQREDVRLPALEPRPRVQRVQFQRPRTTRTGIAYTVRSRSSRAEPLPEKKPVDLARALAQKQQMDRLALRPEHGLMASMTSCRGKSVFICEDGTRLPYEVLGSPSLDVRSFSFVIVHDLFDTFDATKIFFRRLVQRHPGCQVLVYNYAGQAGTSFFPPTDKTTKRRRPRLDEGQDRRILTVDAHVTHLRELLRHIDNRGEMLAETPFWVAGIGLGFRIASRFAVCVSKNDDDDDRGGGLRGLISINGVVEVDAQLGAILKSALGAYQHFPVDRPDLPVSFIAKFLFSDAYLSRVDPGLALNIYTAVANSITLQGRIALIQGALLSESTKAFAPMPLFILQSTDDAMVPPSQVTTLLTTNKYTPRHVWSHEIENAGGLSIGQRGRMLVRDTVSAQPRGEPIACVFWVNAGHAVRQERAAVVEDLFDTIAPYCAPGKIDVSEKDDDKATSLEKRTCSWKIKDRVLQPVDNEDLCVEGVQIRKPLDVLDRAASRQAPAPSAPVPAAAPLPEGEAPATRPATAPPEQILDESEPPPGLTEMTFTLAIQRLRFEDYRAPVRTALVDDVASSVAKVLRLPILAWQVEVRGIHRPSGHVNVGITSVALGTARQLETLILANDQRLLPGYWGAHRVTHIPARPIGSDDTVHSVVVVEKKTPVPDDVVSVSMQNQPDHLVLDDENDDEVQPDVEDHDDVVVEDEPPPPIVVVVTKDEPLMTTKEQRVARRYVEVVEPAAQSVIKETDEFQEMQRQADIDAADVAIVKAGLAPAYAPPPGEVEPVIRPSPVDYKEGHVPERILRRHDVLRVLDKHHLAPPPAPSATSSHKTVVEESSSSDHSSAIKREVASADLIREADLVALLNS